MTNSNKKQRRVCGQDTYEVKRKSKVPSQSMEVPGRLWKTSDFSSVQKPVRFHASWWENIVCKGNKLVFLPQESMMKVWTKTSSQVGRGSGGSKPCERAITSSMNMRGNQPCMNTHDVRRSTTSCFRVACERQRFQLSLLHDVSKGVVVLLGHISSRSRAC